MFKAGLLLLTGSLRCVVESISNYLSYASKNVGKRLYVKLEPEFNEPLSKSDTSYLNRLSKSIPLIYFKAAAVCSNLDVRVLLPQRGMKNGLRKSFFDVVLTNSLDDKQNIMRYMEKQFDNSCQNIIKVENVNIPEGINKWKESDAENYSEFKVYQSVCMGGTFDRLHNGHKVLLSEAVMRTSGKLFVGIIDGQMLERKVLSELIEPTYKRIEKVQEFLSDIDPSIQYEVAPILDPFGPTVTDSDIECIVVSQETKPGGEKINVERTKKGMNKLDIYIVDLLESNTSDATEEAKLSSTSIRKKLLGTLQKPGSVPDVGKPFHVLLMGPPTSGKSCISRVLQALGAEIISCDKEISNFLTEEMSRDEKIRVFYEENICPDNSFDYKKLTKVLLKDQSKRIQFCSEILDKVKGIIEKKIDDCVNKGAKVILLQSSVILDLDWKSKVHEVWTTVLPVRENIRRLCECYEFTEEEATNVLSSVPSNKENVHLANVIFSNQWTPEFTKNQVERAWAHLQETWEK